MGKSHGTIRDRINLCGSCYKPIGKDDYFIVLGNRGLKKYFYHNTAQLCASAEPLQKDWYRQYDRTKTYHGAKSRLQEVDGHKGYADNDMSLWLGDLES